MESSSLTTGDFLSSSIKIINDKQSGEILGQGFCPGPFVDKSAHRDIGEKVALKVTEESHPNNDNSSDQHPDESGYISDFDPNVMSSLDVSGKDEGELDSFQDIPEVPIFKSWVPEFDLYVPALASSESKSDPEELDLPSLHFPEIQDSIPVLQIHVPEFDLSVLPVASSESKFEVKSLDEDSSADKKEFETETSETDTDSDSEPVSDAEDVKCDTNPWTDIRTKSPEPIISPEVAEIADEKKVNYDEDEEPQPELVPDSPDLDKPYNRALDTMGRYLTPFPQDLFEETNPSTAESMSSDKLWEEKIGPNRRYDKNIWCWVSDEHNMVLKSGSWTHWDKTNYIDFTKSDSPEVSSQSADADNDQEQEEDSETEVKKPNVVTMPLSEFVDEEFKKFRMGKCDEENLALTGHSVHGICPSKEFKKKSPLLGLTLIEGLVEDKKGIFVYSVDEDSPLFGVITPGDHLLKMNSKDLKSVSLKKAVWIIKNTKFKKEHCFLFKHSDPDQVILPTECPVGHAGGVQTRSKPKPMKVFLSLFLY